VQWSDTQAIWFFVAIAVLVVFVVLKQSQRSKQLRERFEMLAREMGWSELESSSVFMLSVQGIWNGYSVRIRRLPRQKNMPERIATNIRVQAPARVIITRRQRGVFTGRPFALFGPPVIDLPLYSQFWIRADEITLAERLLRGSAAGMLDRMLQSRHDLFRLGGDQLLVQRISAIPPDEVARLAREELELLKVVIDALALRP
jgi:hypothetical protein